MVTETVTIRHAGREFAVEIHEQTLGISYTDGGGRRVTGWNYCISEDGVECYGGEVWPLPSRDLCKRAAEIWVYRNRRPLRTRVRRLGSGPRP